MTTRSPARLLRATGGKGKLDPGKGADLCVADESLRVCLTTIRRKVVYAMEEFSCRS